MFGLFTPEFLSYYSTICDFYHPKPFITLHKTHFIIFYYFIIQKHFIRPML